MSDRRKKGFYVTGTVRYKAPYDEKVHDGSFSRLKEEANWTFEDAEPYIESLIAFYQDHHQTTFRVMEASEVRRLQRIPCRQVLQEIFNGKFIELKNGMLRYKR